MVSWISYSSKVPFLISNPKCRHVEVEAQAEVKAARLDLRQLILTI
jgi:hypothetical protein